MNPENYERQISALEKRVMDLETAQGTQVTINKLLMAILTKMADDTVTRSCQSAELSLKSQDNNERLFEIFGRLLPVEMHANFQLMLNHSKVNRDQLEGMLEQVKSQPKVADILKIIMAKKPEPPANPPSSPA